MDVNENRSIKTDFDRALAENAVALEKFGALTEQEREKLRRRAARAADFTAMREIISDFVGWQEGHGASLKNLNESEFFKAGFHQV